MSDRLRLDLVLNDFVACALALGEITVLSDGLRWRPLIDVSDMARAIEWAMTRSAENGGRYLAVNAGSNGWNYQVKDIAEAVTAELPGTTISVNQKRSSRWATPTASTSPSTGRLRRFTNRRWHSRKQCGPCGSGSSASVSPIRISAVRAGSACASSRSTSSLVGCRRGSGGWPTALARGRECRMKFTAIWQSKKPHELPWIAEIFGDLIAEHVFDGNHEVVLDDAILLDGFIKRVPHDYYRKFEGKNAFLVHFLDETYEGGYERYDHFRGVIRNFWSTAFNPRKVFILPTGYWNPAKPQFKTFTPASRRKYLWSFDGELRKSSRLDAVKALRRIEPHFLRDTGPTYEKPTLSFKPEYQEVLTDSAFAPAPMGNVTLETFRMYEALELGSIPLIETRRAYPYFEHVLGRHPLPSFERWSDATAFVERYARDPAALDALQRSCLDWWADFKVGLSGRVRDFIASAPQDRQGEAAFHTALPHPIWQVAELVHQHSFAALRRRAVRQLRRVLFEQRFRSSP